MPTFTIHEADRGRGNIFGLPSDEIDDMDDMVSKNTLLAEQRKMNSSSRWRLMLLYCRFGAASVAISLSLLALGAVLLASGFYCYKSNRRGWQALLLLSLVPLVPGLYGSVQIARVMCSESRGDAGAYLNMDLLGEEEEVSFSGDGKETFL